MNLNAQILLFLNQHYFPLLWTILLLLLIYKGINFPYPPAALQLEIFSLFPFASVELCRFFMGNRGNKLEDKVSIAIFAGLTVMSILAHLFYCLWQTYVMLLDVIASGIGRTKSSVIMSSIEEVVDVPPEVQRRVASLQNLQDKHSELEAKFRDEVMQLEKKYHALYQPLYEKRSEIVLGKVEPTDSECERKKTEDEEELRLDINFGTRPVKGLPSFWLTALKNNPIIGQSITEKDEEALKHLEDIKLEYMPDNPGFKLEFFFSENEFFTDSTLVKSYYLINSPDTSYGDIVFDRAEGSVIHWKEGKDLSVTIEIKKQRHKASNKTRTVKKTVPAETFFSFFSPPKQPSEDDEEVEEDLDERVEADFEIGEIIKEKIIPNAVDWFTGKALQFEDDGDYDDDGFIGDGDEDEDDEDDDGDGDAAAGETQEKPPEVKVKTE